jgi:hypothetical protein
MVTEEKKWPNNPHVILYLWGMLQDSVYSKNLFTDENLK